MPDLFFFVGLVGSIQRWDSDRYLGNVYHWLTAKYPSATAIFLGIFLFFLFAYLL